MRTPSAAGGFLLADLDSINGTLVGGQKIQEHALKHGEEFEIGNNRMKLYTSVIADTQKLEEAAKPAFHPAIRTEETVLTGQTISHYAVGAAAGPGQHGHDLQGPRHPKLARRPPSRCSIARSRRDEENLRRFMQVMKTTVGLHHSNLVAICDAGKQGESCWFAMEYVEGEPLVKIIEHLGTKKMISWRYAPSMGWGSPTPWRPSTRSTPPITTRRPRASDRTKDKVPKLGDMMRARVMNGVEVKPATRPGELTGNVAYLAPERTRGDAEVDIRSDIYSLGATLYTLPAGRPPFEGKTLVETVARIRQEDPIPPKRFQDAIPDEFQDVVEKMLAKCPELRYPTPAAVARVLGHVAKAQATASDPNKSAFIRLSSQPGSTGGGPVGG